MQLGPIKRDDESSIGKGERVASRSEICDRRAIGACFKARVTYRVGIHTAIQLSSPSSSTCIAQLYHFTMPGPRLAHKVRANFVAFGQLTLSLYDPI